MATEYGSGGDISVTMDGPFAGSGYSGGGNIKIVSISAPTANWKGGESPFSMSVGVDGVSISSKVDVQLSPEQMALIGDQIITFLTVNNGGNVTLYAYGDKPKADLVLQATVAETDGEGVVMGGMASTNVPRSDYAQTDSTKADFIKNKPDAAIFKAQKTADDAATAAKTAAENSLPKKGGTMTGNIDMGGNTVSGLKDPADNADAANKGYVDSRHIPKEVTLAVDGWVGDAAPYTQDIAVEGLLITDIPHYGVVYSANAQTALLEKEAFSLVDDLDTSDGKVTFTCFEDKPAVALRIQMEVNR